MEENNLISIGKCESGVIEDKDGKCYITNVSNYREGETSNIEKLTFQNVEELKMNGRTIDQCGEFIYKRNISQSCNAVPSKEETNKYASAYTKGEEILKTFYKSGVHLRTEDGKTAAENPKETWLTFHTGDPYQHNDLRAKRSMKKGTDKDSKNKKGQLEVIKGDNTEIDAAANYASNRNHAEFAMIQALKKMGVHDTKVYVHINYSPCKKCATDLKDIADDNNLHFNMKVVSLYRINRNSCIGRKCPCLENQKKKEKEQHRLNGESLLDLSENKRLFTLTFFDKNDWFTFKSEICRYIAENMSQPDSIDYEGKINSFIKCDLKCFLELRCEEDKLIIKDLKHLKNNRMESKLKKDIKAPISVVCNPSSASLENDGTMEFVNHDTQDNAVKEYSTKRGYRKDNLNHATPQQKDLQQKNSEKELTSSELTSTQADTDTTHDSSLQIAKPVFKYNVHAPDFIPKASAQDNNN